VAVTLRLARHGDKKRPYYRVIAAESTKKRDGRFIEVLGHYHPRFNPAQVILKEDKIKKWLAVGAQTTEKVRALIRKAFPGLIEAREEHQLAKIRDARRKRKQRAAGKDTAGKEKKAGKAKAKK
jgi:small subunit ribosomal protein S16